MNSPVSDLLSLKTYSQEKINFACSASSLRTLHVKKTLCSSWFFALFVTPKKIAFFQSTHPQPLSFRTYIFKRTTIPKSKRGELGLKISALSMHTLLSLHYKKNFVLSVVLCALCDTKTNNLITAEGKSRRSHISGFSPNNAQRAYLTEG